MDDDNPVRRAPRDLRPPADEVGVDRRRFGRRGRVASWVFGLAFLGFWVWFTNGHVNYVVISPGPTSNVDERLTVKGTAQYATTHNVLWATVNLKDSPPPLDVVVGWLKGDSDVFERRTILGDTSRAQSDRESRAEMDDAKLVAGIVAGRRAGAVPTGGGATVLEIAKGVPAAGVLHVGDVITAADGRAVCLQGDLRAALARVHPGAAVRLGVRRKGASASTDVNVRTVARAGFSRALIGITAGPVGGSPCRLPFTVSVDARRVGGPSAGLAMTLAILDRLTPGDLLGAGPVAVTGTIEADGSVQEVGGVKQKTLAVKAAGAKLFIVPMSEVAIAQAHAGRMRVVGVTDLEGALVALRQLGGTPLPSPSR